MKNNSSNNEYMYLLRIFIIFSSIAIICILLLVTFGIYKIYSNHIILDAEADAVHLGLMLFEQEKSVLLSHDPKGKTHVSVSEENFPGLDRRMRKYLQPLQVVKIKIFSKGGKIVYSTDHTIIGKTDKGNEKLEKSLTGKSVSKLETKDKVWDLAGEERLNLDLVETYSPIRDKDNNVIGSFEIYVDITRYRTEIKNIVVLSTGVVFVILVCVFGSLFIVLKRATRTFERLLQEQRRLVVDKAIAKVEHKRAQELKKSYNELNTAQQAIAESEERFRRAVLNSPFPIMIHAENGKVVQINKVWTELTGYTPEEIPTLLEWTRRAYGKEMVVLKARIEKIFSYDSRVKEGEYTISTKDGKKLIWDFSSAPLGKLPDGRRLVISIAMDVTERKRSQKELSQKVLELERFNKLMVGRELMMAELKKRIKELEKNR